MNRKRAIIFAPIAVIGLFLLSNIILYANPQMYKSSPRYSISLDNSIDAYTNETIEFKAVVKPTSPAARPFWEFDVNGKTETKEGAHRWEIIGDGMGWPGRNYTRADPSLYRTFYRFEKEGLYEVGFYLKIQGHKMYYQTIWVSILRADLSFSLNPVKNCLHPGEVILIKAAIENRGPLPVYVQDFCPGLTFDYSVTSLSGALIYPKGQGYGIGFGAGTVPHWSKIPPFSSLSTLINLTQQGILNSTGMYTVTGNYHDIWSGRNSGDYWQGVLWSKETFFEITS